MDFTGKIAEFIRATRFEDLPEDVIKHAQRSLVDWLGVSLGASHDPSVDMLLRVCNTLGGNPQATVIGRGSKVSLAHAALINGHMSHVLDFDDTHLDTMIHPSATIWPAALAVGEEYRLSGKAMLTAFITGYEVETRIGRSVYPDHYDAGWHITGTVGTFGSAVAVAKLLRLDRERLVQALGIAGNQAAGLREMFGTMCKPFNAGRAARDGLMAALLARAGFTGSGQILEAPKGFCNLASPKADLGKILEGLGREFEIRTNAIKPYACGVVTHPTIDGIIALRNTHGLSGHEVKAIQVQVHPLVLELTGRKEPTTGLEGKFSIYHCAAVALIDGEALPTQFTDGRVCTEDVRVARSRVTVHPDPNLAKDEAVVTVMLYNGDRLTSHIQHARGSKEHPLTDDELEKKFSAQAAGILTHERQQRLLELIWDLETEPDVGKLAILVACSPYGSF